MTSKVPPSAARERELFLDALELPLNQRGAFLDEACGQDQSLRARIEALLHDHENSGAFLETPAIHPSLKGDTVPLAQGISGVSEQAGDHIGRYKLLQKIGEGGCGIVYMAEQQEPVRRRVALKIIKLGMDTKSVIARFEAERQALAMMDHPNIAKVFDAGATETGRPFFVMELVRGVRITEYCDQHQVTTDERLQLFIQVCQALQHAHQKGVIHRDIKPSNILVTLHDTVPVPKVIDFGIAKATEQRLTEKTLFTEFQSFIGTPAYMSPEQAEMSGLDIDTRSDIYSLGVLLYEVLTGKTPFDAESLIRSGLDECRKTIREKEPVRPSTRLATMLDLELTTTAKQRQTDAPRLIHTLRGDLDWIVMKSLEKDRTRRYATANDLAADVQRYLDGDTVLARPPSKVYRLQKMLRRHRRAFAAGVAITVALIAGLTISTWQAIRATRAENLESGLRRQAELQRERAEQQTLAARLNEYVADMNLAEQSRLAENYGRAVQLLEKHRPRDGQPDLRGFEWRYLWQLTRGDEHTAFQPPTGEPVHSLSVSPNGEMVAVGVGEKVTVWSVRFKNLLRTLTLPRGPGSAAFLPDGRYLVTESFGNVRIWDVSNWQPVTNLANHSGPIAYSGDGTRLAAMSRDGVRVWDTSSWQEVQLLRSASPPMSFSHNGQLLATDTRNGAGMTVWSLDDASGVLLDDSTNVLARPGLFFRGSRTLAMSPDGHYVAAARNMLSTRGVFIVSVWDAESGEEIATMPDDADHIEHTGAITSLQFSPDGRTLATAALDYSIRLWNFETGARSATLQGHLSEVWSLAYFPDGEAIVSGAKNGEVKIWPTYRTEPEETVPGARLPIAFSSDGRSLAALTRRNSIVIVDASTGETQREWTIDAPRAGPDGSAFGGPGRRGRVPNPPLAMSADLRRLVVRQDDGSLKMWDNHSGHSKLLDDVNGAPAAISPDGRILITIGWDRSCRWLDLDTGETELLTNEVSRAFFSPNGKNLALFGRSNQVEILEVPGWTRRVNFFVEPALGLAAAFSPDARELAVICQDDVIRLYEVFTGDLIGSFSGHKQTVYTAAFSPDGKTLATASDDSTLKFWNVATRQELLTIRRLGGGLRGLLFSPDGNL